MNIIKNYGSYENAKAELEKIKGTKYRNWGYLEAALLEYRRANGIFEVGDPVTHIQTGLRGTVSPQEFSKNYIFIDFPDEDFVECRYSEVRHVELEVLNDIDIPPSTIILGDK